MAAPTHRSNPSLSTSRNPQTLRALSTMTSKTRIKTKLPRRRSLLLLKLRAGESFFAARRHSSSNHHCSSRRALQLRWSIMAVVALLPAQGSAHIRYAKRSRVAHQLACQYVRCAWLDIATILYNHYMQEFHDYIHTSNLHHVAGIQYCDISSRSWSSRNSSRRIAESVPVIRYVCSHRRGQQQKARTQIQRHQGPPSLGCNARTRTVTSERPNSAPHSHSRE